MRTSRNMTFFLPGYQPVTKIFVILYMATSYNILAMCVSLALSCVGALGAGIMLGTGLNWGLFVTFAIIAIVGSVWTSRLLRTVPNVGLIIKYNFPKDAGYYQNGKRKTTPVNGNDILYHIKMFLPFIQIGMFIFSAVLFGGPHQTHDTSRSIGALNAKNSYKANGLYGHVSDLFFVDENTGHVDFCHVTSSMHIL